MALWVKMGDEAAPKVARALRSAVDPEVEAIRRDIEARIKARGQTENLTLQEIDDVIAALECVSCSDAKLRLFKAITSALPKLRRRADRMRTQQEAETGAEEKDQAGGR